MDIKAVLFDLDGTLLPMNQDEFVKTYFGLLAKHLAPFGYNPDELVKGIMYASKYMILNSGEATNEEVFWQRLSQVMGEKCLEDTALFDEYYHSGFLNVKKVCGYNPEAKKTLDAIKEKGFRVALATQPLFPTIATKTRITWAGIELSEFEYFTAFENSRHSKPNPEYYRDVAASLGLEPSQCLMVGNDVSDDMVAKEIGMKVFLLTDCLLNKDNADISQYPNGNFAQLREYLGIDNSK